MSRIYRNDVSPITREKQSLSHTGRHHSEETKKKISSSMIEYWGSLPFKPITTQEEGEKPTERRKSPFRYEK